MVAGNQRYPGSRLRKQDPEHGASVDVLHPDPRALRAAMPGYRRPGLEIRSPPQSCVPSRSRPSRASRSRHDRASPCGGPSSAIGSFRSLTTILVPRDAIRRYLLRWAFSSVTLMAFMARLSDHDGLETTGLAVPVLEPLS